MQSSIRQDHAYQCNQRQIQSLSEHLGPDQHISLVRGKFIHDLPVGAFGAGGISIPPQCPDPGDQLLESGFHLFSAGAQMPDSLTPAIRADLGNFPLITAVMAA